MPPRAPENPFSALRALGLLGSLGLAVAVCVVAGVAAGLWLDKKFQGGGLGVALGALTGVAAGLVAAYRILARELPWNR